MSRIPVLTREQLPEASHAIYDQLSGALGRVPNLFGVLSSSTPVQEGVVGLQRSLSKTLTVRIRHLISLAVSQVNGCQYCLSAHTFTSTRSKMTEEDIELGRRGRAQDPKENAAASFARKLVELRGKVSNDDVGTLRSAGFENSEIVEIIALCAQFSLTNLMNNALDLDIDFPVVSVDLP